MQFVRGAACGVFLVLASQLSMEAAAAAASDSGIYEPKAVEVVGLRSIAGWLRQHGKEGYVGADVAAAAGIPRADADDTLQARQRGFRNESNVLRIAQFVIDEKREYILFMVQRPDDQVFFYLSTVREGLKKAFVSIPSRGAVVPLERLEAESGFHDELRYWQDRAAISP